MAVTLRQVGEKERGFKHEWNTITTPDSGLELRLLAGAYPRILAGFLSRFQAMTEHPVQALQESRRRAYLEVMGIHVYPVGPHPGSAVRPSATSESELETASRVVQATVPSPRPDAPRVAKPATLPATTRSDNVAPLRFRLQYFQISDQLSVINELPYEPLAEGESDVLKLLQGVLQALGAASGAALKTADMVCSWPMEGAENTTAERPDDARDMVRFFIKGRLANRPGSCLLIFAGACAGLLSEPDADLQQGQLPDWLTQLECRVVITHSLSAMLKVPDLKKTAWQALRPLAGLISN